MSKGVPQKSPDFEPYPNRAQLSALRLAAKIRTTVPGNANPLSIQR
jgi:hypothetical protein